MKRFLAALLVVAAAGTARAETELLMLEEKWCDWCARWNEEVGVVYDKTTEGRTAPLRRHDIHTPLPGDVTLLRRAHYTPTFVLLVDGQEVGRIEGYPGEDFFYGMLGQLLEKREGM